MLGGILRTILFAKIKGSGRKKLFLKLSKLLKKPH